MTGWLFDALLAVALPVLAWQTLATRDLFKAVVLFICFGLLVSLSWVRLDAPDIALAEAAIGAGVTGAPASRVRSRPWAPRRGRPRAGPVPRRALGGRA